jgi:hypothetical protein
MRIKWTQQVCIVLLYLAYWKASTEASESSANNTVTSAENCFRSMEVEMSHTVRPKDHAIKQAEIFVSLIQTG